MFSNSEQLRCIKVACSLRRNLFYTGPGGVGKSLVARAIIDFFRCHLTAPAEELAITAPTGIAATHIGGTTIHSAAGVGVPTFAVDFKKCWGKKEAIRRWNVLILDEVSMLSGEFWDWLFTVLMEINPTVQLIFCGDFFQLPPISKQLELTMQARDLSRAVDLSERTAMEVKQVKEAGTKCNRAIGSFDFSATVAKGRKAMQL